MMFCVWYPMARLKRLSLMVCVLGLVVSLSGQSKEKQVNAEGTYRYGPDVSKNLACARARLDLRINALRKWAGERVSQFSSLSCDSSRSKQFQNECQLRENIWSYLGSGVFVRSLNVNQEIDRPVADARECFVSGQVMLNQITGEPDPLFVTRVEIYPSARLQEGEIFKVRLDSTQQAFHYLFSWDLNSDHQELDLLFPNSLDNENYFDGVRELPADEGRGDYDLQAILGEEDSYSLEQLILLSSKVSLGQLPPIRDLPSLMRVVGSMKRVDWAMTELSYEVIKRTE